MARTGRRPGHQHTREAILAAAREAFAEKGFDRASVRQIAAGAGVDPALVHHYFGTKDQLFLDALSAPIDPGKIIDGALAGPGNGMGERLLRTMLGVWDSPTGGAALAMLRSAVANEVIAKMLRDLILQRIFKRVAKALDLDPAEAALRMNLVATQISGLIMVRYIIKMDPIASTPVETIVRLVAPTVQRYLTEPLPSEHREGDAQLS